MNWNYIHIDTRETMTMSGWKLYIFGETNSDAIIVLDSIFDTVTKYNLTTKIATPEIIRRNRRKNIPWGVAVIYLTELIFRDRLFYSLIEELNEDLKGYEKSGRILGAKSINNKIHYRYDLNISVDPEIGIEYYDYLLLYRGEYGLHDIPGNKDLINSAYYEVQPQISNSDKE